MLCMNAQQINWDNLAYFLATARAGTLVAAADELGVNHSTVYRRISSLESELDVRLFDRSQQGYELTQTGEELLDHVLAIEKQLHTIGRKIAGRDQALRGTVRLTTVDDLAVTVLPPILDAFHEANPAVTVDLEVQTDFADLARMETDVAIRFGKPPDEPRVVGRRIASAPTFLYGSRRYLEERGRPRSPADLAAHDIVRGTARFSRLGSERLLEQHVPPENVTLRANSMLVRHAAVRAGLGLGYLPYFIAEDDDELEHLGIEVDETANIWMLLHADVRRNARVRAFADFVYERLVAMRPRLAPGEDG